MNKFLLSIMVIELMAGTALTEPVAGQKIVVPSMTFQGAEVGGSARCFRELEDGQGVLSFILIKSRKAAFRIIGRLQGTLIQKGASIQQAYRMLGVPDAGVYGGVICSVHLYAELGVILKTDIKMIGNVFVEIVSEVSFYPFFDY